MHNFTCSLVAIFAALLGRPATAADTATTAFNPLQTFAPYHYPQPATAYRSASGVPGPLYWQNQADYQIKATLDPATRQLSGSEVITYTNHSPDTLDVLWLQVEQNRYRKHARGAFGGAKFPTEFTGGEHIRSIEVEDASGHRQKTKWVISDTRMQVTLPTALKGHGGQLKLHIRWDYTVPSEFGGRTDVNANQQGDIFEMAQWYPRLCVYGDLRGWDTQPYLN
ncbi:MAG: M1 family peptidase, partial [Rhodanobacter sp.]